MSVLSRWLRRRRVDRELAAEMAEHLAEKIDQLREEGYAEPEAVALARRQFGNLTLLQEDSRAAWGWNTAEQFWQDIRFGWRVLGRRLLHHHYYRGSRAWHRHEYGHVQHGKSRVAQLAAVS